MSEEMQQDAVDCATQALEKYNIEKVSGYTNGFYFLYTAKNFFFYSKNQFTGKIYIDKIVTFSIALNFGGFIFTFFFALWGLAFGYS